MVAGSLERTLISKAGYKESKVPTRYTLNKGHLFFFIIKVCIYTRGMMLLL